MNARMAMRFLLVGVANTAVGLLVVVSCAQWFGWPPFAANGAGYAAGLGFGFILNRGWTFGDRRQVTITAPRYLMSFALSYAANAAVLAAGLDLALSAPVAQMLALSTYSVVFFLLSRYFVFTAGTT
jgi:putative flippase GtrA